MILDDRPADRKTQPGPGRLRREERLEDPLPVGLGDSRPGVFHREENGRIPARLCDDPQVSSAAIHRRHRLDGVSHQIQKNLLQQRSVAS
jgi:hypothetical protein